MLEIHVPAIELFNEIDSTIVDIKPQYLQLEHSLVSISKWESKWCKAFINTEKTREETIDYVRCMTINIKNIDPEVYKHLPANIVDKIYNYINAPMTATAISNNNGGGKTKVTSELIYYWMIGLNIPVEFEKWHINRLFALISLCEEKSKPEKKMTTREVMEQNRRINEMRKKQLNTHV